LTGHRVSRRSTGDALKVGRGVGDVDTRSPKHEVRNNPAAAAADLDMNSRRDNRDGNTVDAV